MGKKALFVDNFGNIYLKTVKKKILKQFSKSAKSYNTLCEQRQ